MDPLKRPLKPYLLSPMILEVVPTFQKLRRCGAGRLRSSEPGGYRGWEHATEENNGQALKFRDYRILLGRTPRRVGLGLSKSQAFKFRGIKLKAVGLGLRL